MRIDDTQEHRRPRQPSSKQTHRESSVRSSRRSVQGAPRSRYANERRRPDLYEETRRPRSSTASRSSAAHHGSAAAAKHPKLSNRQRIKTAVFILVILILSIFLILHLPVIPYTTMDHLGNETTTHISLMKKFRHWQPFLDIDGDLESKTYSMEPKKELEGVLIEYSMCKSASAELAKMYCGSDIFVRNPLEITHSKIYTLEHKPSELAQVYGSLSAVKKVKAENRKAEIENRINSVVQRRIVSVLSKAVHILRELCSKGSAGMEELYSGITDRSARVAVFLALLELTKSGRIGISDDNMTVFFKGRKDGKTWKSKRKSVH